MTFLIKRAHLMACAAGRAIFEHIEGMTPARFDILCLLRQKQLRFGGGRGVQNMNFSTQQAIQRALDLHHSTVSKMLSRLAEMKWITCERDLYNGDKRRNVIELTKLGLRKIWQAMRLLWRERILLKDFEQIARLVHPTWHVLEGLAHLDGTLSLIGRFLGDESTFYYGWGAPDRVPYALRRITMKRVPDYRRPDRTPFERRVRSRDMTDWSRCRDTRSPSPIRPLVD